MWWQLSYCAWNFVASGTRWQSLPDRFSLSRWAKTKLRSCPPIRHVFSVGSWSRYIKSFMRLVTSFQRIPCCLIFVDSVIRIISSCSRWIEFLGSQNWLWIKFQSHIPIATFHSSRGDIVGLHTRSIWFTDSQARSFARSESPIRPLRNTNCIIRGVGIWRREIASPSHSFFFIISSWWSKAPWSIFISGCFILVLISSWSRVL